MDLLGSGYSDKLDGFGYTVSDHADYPMDFVAPLGVDRFGLLGHRLRGAVALSRADRSRLAWIGLSEAKLDSGDGVLSRAVAAYTERDFVDRGFYEIIGKSRQASNETWAASRAVASPVALYRSAQSVIAGQRPRGRRFSVR